MSLKPVSLKLSRKTSRDAGIMASGEDVTIGHLVRNLLAKEIDRRLTATSPGWAEEGLVAALQTLLAPEFAQAEGWDDLAIRLRRHGYELRAVAGDLTLFKTSCGTRLCKGSELGFTDRSLVERFQTGMPGHPQGGNRLAHKGQPIFDVFQAD